MGATIPHEVETHEFLAILSKKNSQRLKWRDSSGDDWRRLRVFVCSATNWPVVGLMTLVSESNYAQKRSKDVLRNQKWICFDSRASWVNWSSSPRSFFIVQR